MREPASPGGAPAWLAGGLRGDIRVGGMSSLRAGRYRAAAHLMLPTHAALWPQAVLLQSPDGHSDERRRRQCGVWATQARQVGRVLHAMTRSTRMLPCCPGCAA